MGVSNRAGVNQSWAQTKDWSARTQPGRDARLKQFLKQVDPDNEMDPETRLKAAKAARKAHCQRMAAKSAKVRQAKKEARLREAEQMRQPGAAKRTATPNEPSPPPVKTPTLAELAAEVAKIRASLAEGGQGE